METVLPAQVHLGIAPLWGTGCSTGGWERGNNRVVSLLAPHLSAPAFPQPLPEMEYNGNPESVGYKIKYSRSDGHGKTLSHMVQDRVEREYTIEDLEEWTEYRVQVQAFNAIGSGPWSQAVVGRTRESGTTTLLWRPPKSRPRSNHFYRQLKHLSIPFHGGAPCPTPWSPSTALPCGRPHSGGVCGTVKQY